MDLNWQRVGLILTKSETNSNSDKVGLTVAKGGTNSDKGLD